MNQKLRRLVAYTSAVAMAGAMTLPIIAGTASANASVRPSTSLSREQIARNFISHLKIGQPRQAVKGLHSQISGPTFVSSNWSGYADTPPTTGGSTYTAVSGSWKEPTAKCPASGIALAAFWVGIDGFSNGTVEQDGTIIECVGGIASYADWWEMYPTNAVQFVNNVNPKDAIKASVSFAAATYTLTVTDKTNPGDSFTTAQACGTTPCDNASAEWIGEAPCCKGNGDVYNLANFGTWNVTKAAETYNGTAGNINSGPTINKIIMEDSHSLVKAKPGAITGGTAFTDTWKKAS